MSSWITLINMF